MESNFTLQVDGMTCGHCVSSVRQALSSVAGVASSDVAVGKAIVSVKEGHAPAAVRQAAEQAIADAGYEVAADGESQTGRASRCCCGTPTLAQRR